MAKLKNPLLSLKASGSVGRVITFLRRGRVDLVEKKPELIDAHTSTQLAWRTMFNLCKDLWHELSAAEKAVFEREGTARHMTGYAWYMSQCLRPNPGIYLPLAGGTMSGDIDMDGHSIEDLPAPAAATDAVRKSYVDALEARYRIGARVYHNAAQAIPHDTDTTVALNSEEYDTDTIHDPVTNNSRLTCKTAGKYLIIAQVRFDPNAVGFRYLKIKINTTSDLGVVSQNAVSGLFHVLATATIWALSLTDFVEIVVKQTSGAPLNLTAAFWYGPHFMMQRVG